MTMTGAHQADFVLWTVYDKPADFPGVYVARKYTLAGPTHSTMQSEDLDALRITLARMGLVQIKRTAEDHPRIIETWI